MITLILLILGVLLASGICSMTEVAILSIPLIRVRLLDESKHRFSKDLMLIKKNIHTAVATIVVINNSINIVGSIFVGRMVTRLFGSEWLGIASAVFTFFIIIISEVIPKTIGEQYKVPISLFSAKPLKVTMLMLKPLIVFVSFISSHFKRKSSAPKVTEEEIKMMLKMGAKEGTVEADERILCNRVFRLNDLKASQMMKPIDRAYSLVSGKTLSQAKNDIFESPYSRIIIYDKDIKNIIGICQQRILLKELSKDNYDAKLDEFMTPPIFVKDDEKADTLLEKFQREHQHLFIVKDRKDKSIGIITMEDVLEELFGEIYDEKESAVKKQKEVRG